MKTHILLIDDDKNELAVFMEALKNIDGDFKCTYAESSDQALEMLKYIQPDFIFVDYNLPNVNGLQVLAVIRNEQKLQRSGVFIYTETINDEIVKMARLLGASGCIEKNATVSWLTHLFKAIFDGRLMPKYAILRNPLQTERLPIDSNQEKFFSLINRYYRIAPDGIKTQAMKQQILIIDDDKDELILFEDALVKVPYGEGFTCIYAANAAHALEILTYITPDYIFVDLNMPEMSGLDFLFKIKETNNLAHTKVFLHSVKITDETYRTAILAGAAGCIKKANTIQDLANELIPVLIGNRLRV